MIIKLVRHGQSESNMKLVDVTKTGDSFVRLTDEGIEQALEAGKIIGKDFIKNAQLFRSPFVRTRETSMGIVAGAGLNPLEIDWIEDPLLREIDLGYVHTEKQMQMRKNHGWFYYRYEGGESPADVYTRCSIFINAMMRKKDINKDVLIVGHGLQLRVFIMRFLKLTPEEYTQMDNINNAEVLTICPTDELPHDANVLFKKKKWSVYGNLEFYHRSVYDPSPFLDKLKEFQ